MPSLTLTPDTRHLKPQVSSLRSQLEQWNGGNCGMMGSGFRLGEENAMLDQWSRRQD